MNPVSVQNVGVIDGGAAEASDTSTSQSRSAQYLVGTNALNSQRPDMRIEEVFQDGVVQNWDAAEALLSYTYKSCLCCNPEDHPLLMAEPSFNPPANREKVTELLFEKFNVPALFLSKNAVLSAFASGRGTALVLDVGGGITSATAVHDGHVLSRPLRKHTLAGDKLNAIGLKALGMQEPVPDFYPLYTLNKSDIGYEKPSITPRSITGLHSSYLTYLQLQVRYPSFDTSI